MIYYTTNSSFDGAIRSCEKFQNKKGKLRCASFKKGLKYPTCPGEGLKGGGRSQKYIRPGKRCKSRGGRASRR